VPSQIFAQATDLIGLFIPSAWFQPGGAAAKLPLPADFAGLFTLY
jgi:hypothetical protein